MKRVGVRMEVRGVPEMNRRFEKKAKQINQEANRGLYNVALLILADAKMLLKEIKNTTGGLRNSGIIDRQKDETVDVVFKSNYASSVEFGRRAGRMPPVDIIKEWVRKKGLADTYTASGNRRKRGADFEASIKGIAFLIARKIARVGTKPRPFLFPALRKNEDKVIAELKKAIKKAL